MSKTHTPGPWEAYEESRNTYIDQKVSDDPDEGYRAIFRLTHAIDVPDETAKANVRLIAAAPELLTSLEGILAHARNAVESDGRAFIDEVHIINVCENAIAKARGQA